MIRTALTLASLGLATSAVAQEPRSMIPWLSNVIDQPPETPSELKPGSGSNTVLPLDESKIEITSLDTPGQDGAGILSAETTGLPRTMWMGTSALRARNLIHALPAEGVPAARRLYRALLLTEANPPAGAGPTNPVLLARVDALMAAGHLSDANDLLRSAGVTDAALFRRAFDISLLTEGVEPLCERMKGAPQLSPTLPARVYCSARLGDWPDAELMLSTGHGLGEISPEQQALLARFLDPTLFESDVPPPVPDPLTTLDFILREAVALPRPTGTLPLAFAIVDAHDDAPLRDRLLSRERLARSDALDPDILFEAYRAGAPAASGGVWDRMDAVQQLDRAFALVDNAAIAEALTAADLALSEQGLRPTMATAYATQLAALSPDDYEPPARHRVAALLLLAGGRDEALPWLATNTIQGDRFLAVLADKAAELVPDGQQSTLEMAIVQGLTTQTPPSEDAGEIAQRIAAGGIAEGVLRTLSLLRPGVEIDPGDLAAALYLLRSAGFEDIARQVALETLLLLPEA